MNITPEERTRMNRNAEINGLIDRTARVDAATCELYDKLDVAYWIACKIAFNDCFSVATIRSLANELHTVLDQERNKLGGMKSELYHIQDGLRSMRELK